MICNRELYIIRPLERLVRYVLSISPVPPEFIGFARYSPVSFFFFLLMVFQRYLILGEDSITSNHDLPCQLLRLN